MNTITVTCKTNASNVTLIAQHVPTDYFPVSPSMIAPHATQVMDIGCTSLYAKATVQPPGLMTEPTAFPAMQLRRSSSSGTSLPSWMIIRILSRVCRQPWVSQVSSIQVVMVMILWISVMAGFILMEMTTWRFPRILVSPHPSLSTTTMPCTWFFAQLTPHPLLELRSIWWQGPTLLALTRDMNYT